MTAAPLNSLVFVTEPANVAAGSTMNTVAVEAEDVYGNPIPSTTINLTISSPGTFAAGTTTVTTGANGIADFPGLVVDMAGTYTLTAAVNSPSISAASTPFTVYPAPPAITSVIPDTDSTSGGAVTGTIVTITGSNLLGATSVSFGGTPATSFTDVSFSEITAVDPPHIAGTVDITVTTGYGTSAITLADQFHYVAEPPGVISINPNSGTTSGGTTVTIIGTNLFGTTAVFFGGTSAASFVVNSPAQITAVTAPEIAGPVDVTVTTAGGNSPTSPADVYTYVAPVPAVLAINPALGPTSGGTTVTITGTGLFGATAVDFGTQPATILTDSPRQMVVTDPANVMGFCDVTVTTAGGTSNATAADQFDYVPPPTLTSMIPNFGPSAGGTAVVITGFEFIDVSQVFFGTTAATSFVVNSPRRSPPSVQSRRARPRST